MLCVRYNIEIFFHTQPMNILPIQLLGDYSIIHHLPFSASSIPFHQTQLSLGRFGLHHLQRVRVSHAQFKPERRRRTHEAKADLIVQRARPLQDIWIRSIVWVWENVKGPQDATKKAFIIMNFAEQDRSETGQTRTVLRG